MQKYLIATRSQAVIGDLRGFSRAFQAYLREKGDWPPGQAPAGQLPAGMVGYLRPPDWEKITPIGGYYHWQKNTKHNDRTVRAAIVISSKGRFKVTADRVQLEDIDRRCDDGNLATGSFLLGFANAPLYIIEPRSLSDLLTNTISSSGNFIGMAVICLDRLLKQRSALRNPDFFCDFPPPRGGLWSLSVQGQIASRRNLELTREPRRRRPPRRHRTALPPQAERGRGRADCRPVSRSSAPPSPGFSHRRREPDPAAGPADEPGRNRPTGGRARRRFCHRRR